VTVPPDTIGNIKCKAQSVAPLLAPDFSLERLLLSHSLILGHPSSSAARSLAADYAREQGGLMTQEGSIQGGTSRIKDTTDYSLNVAIAGRRASQSRA